MSDNTRTFTDIDPQILERFRLALESGDIIIDDCQLKVMFQGLRVDGDGLLHASNFKAVDAEILRYHATLVEFQRPDGSVYKDLVFVENAKGRDKIGDVVVQVRLDPISGRYKVHVQAEDYKRNETTAEKSYRATRSSVPNPVQAIKKKFNMIDMPFGDSLNSRRIVGLRVEQHFQELDWPTQMTIDVNEYRDICDYADDPDGPGHAAFFRAFKYIKSMELKFELIRQMSDPERRKFPRKSNKK